MHDTVINNAFFALLALGASVVGVAAVSQVAFAVPSIPAGAEVAQRLTSVVFGG